MDRVSLPHSESVSLRESVCDPERDTVPQRECGREKVGESVWERRVCLWET